MSYTYDFSLKSMITKVGMWLIIGKKAIFAKPRHAPRARSQSLSTNASDLKTGTRGRSISQMSFMKNLLILNQDLTFF